MKVSTQQIISLGGGGFSSENGEPTFLPYILAASGKSCPHILYIPTAKGDSDSDILAFYTAVAEANCRARHLSLFRQPIDMVERMKWADIIYVGGGNTRNMIAIWRVAGVDKLLRSAWENGIVLCGESAGGVCWFEKAQTKAAGGPGGADGLGFLSGSCVSHYDNEADRRPHFHEQIASGQFPNGYGISNGAALHFVGQELKAVLACKPEGRAYRIEQVEGRASETELQTCPIE